MSETHEIACHIEAAELAARPSVLAPVEKA
jgi:peptide/nickel transport system ATP-binding protein